MGDQRTINWNGVVFVVCVLIACLFFAGDPDLMDAIIKRVGGYE